MMFESDTTSFRELSSTRSSYSFYDNLAGTHFRGLYYLVRLSNDIAFGFSLCRRYAALTSGASLKAHH